MSVANVARLKRKATEFEQKKQFDRALDLYVQVLEEAGRDLDDSDLQLYSRVGDLLQRQGNMGDALSYYEKAVDVYAERGFLNNAIALCNRILRQSPGRAGVYYKLGKISAAKGFKSDAKKNFLEYADRMQKGGQVDEAFRALKEFADLCPDQDDIRLMLAEWLKKENRRSEAVEQLETLYNKFEAEGRSAEARATMDRIKAIDPEVVLRPSGAWVAQKSNDLVFLDLDAEVVATPMASDAQPSPEVDGAATRTLDSSRIPALDGLIITFDPDVEAGGEGEAPAAAPSGFEATMRGDDADIGGDVAEPIAMDGFEPTNLVAEGEGDDRESLPSPTEESRGRELEEVPMLSGLETPSAALSGAHPALSPLMDEPPLSGEAFSSIPLDLVPEPLGHAAPPRGEHDLALPTNLPLLSPEDAPIDLLAVVSIPLNTSANAGALEGKPSDGIDLLALPPLNGGEVSAELGDPEPGDLELVDALLSIDVVAPSAEDAFIVERPEGLYTGAEPAADALSMWGELDILSDAAVESRSTEAPEALVRPDDASLGELVRQPSEEEGDAALPLAEVDRPEREAERPRRDTVELVAQDDTSRATDEIIAVPSEDIDEDIKRSLRLEFALQEDGEPDTWVEVSPAVGIPDTAAPVPPEAQFGGDDPIAPHEEGALPPLEGEGAAEGGTEATENDADLLSIDPLESLGNAPYPTAGAELEINLLDELTAPFVRDGERPETEASVAPPAGPAANASDDHATGSALNVHALRTMVEQRDGASVAPDGVAGGDDHSGSSEGAHQPDVLPLLELGAGDDTGPGDAPTLDLAPFELEPDTTVNFLPGADDLDDAYAPDLLFDDAHPALPHDIDAAVPESPSDERAPDPGEADDWPAEESPEILIDGEWRDENMRDLVSEERPAIEAAADEIATRVHSRFDDLAAAAMWGSPDDDASGAGRRLTPAEGNARFAHAYTPRSTLSLGGVEAQLRRRLELDPRNVDVRRQLGETLLDQGDRDAGLAELDLAMRVYEQAGDLDGARSVADIVLRVIPTSILHHQKCVEYAVRSGDRVRLVEAYVELADSLFRSGDPEKAKVVYGRVLDLAPGNGRARFALGLLSSSDEAADGPETPSHGAPSTSSMAHTTPIHGVATLFEAGSEGRTLAERGEREREEAFRAVSADASVVLEPSPTAPESADEASADEASAGGVPSERTRADQAPAGEVPAPRAMGESRGASPQASLTPSRDGSASHASPERSCGPLEDEDEFIDLGSWLRAEEPARSTRMVTAESTPTGDEQADFDEMLRRFKQGVAANVDEEDFASHYDLGVAYKEMGLVDEAISEFQKSLRGDTHRVRSYEALGQCFVEKGQFQVAATLLRRALETSGADDQQLVGVLYLLGYASEVMARQADALGYYQRVFAVDIEFRDVAQRVAAMEHVTQ